MAEHWSRSTRREADGSRTGPGARVALSIAMLSAFGMGGALSFTYLTGSTSAASANARRAAAHHAHDVRRASAQTTGSVAQPEPRAAARSVVAVAQAQAARTRSPQSVAAPQAAKPSTVAFASTALRRPSAVELAAAQSSRVVLAGAPPVVVPQAARVAPSPTTPQSTAATATDPNGRLVARVAPPTNGDADDSPDDDADAGAGPVRRDAAPQPTTRADSGRIGYERDDGEPCIVRATSVISARLLTHVDSELPGGVIKAQVTTPVNCASGALAIPEGTIVQGTYDVALTGGSRLPVRFDRLIFAPSRGYPNGRAYDLGGQSGGDPLGGNGAGGRVNTHAGRMFGQALLYAFVDAVGSMASVATAVSNGGANATADSVGISISPQAPPQRQPAKPTIYIDPGAPLALVLQRDLPMDPLK